jgi:hypothetical protein
MKHEQDDTAEKDELFIIFIILCHTCKGTRQIFATRFDRKAVAFERVPLMARYSEA